MKIKPTISVFVIFLMIACSGEPVEVATPESSEESKDQLPPEDVEASLELIWETDTSLITNESVLYYPEKGQILVSNINGKPTDQDGNGYLSLLDIDGAIEVQEWVTGLDAPKGMAISNGTLYVTNIDELVEVDIAEGIIKNRYAVDGAKFLNDVSIGQGVVYFSDMTTGKLHALVDGEVLTIAEGLDNLNGLAYNDETRKLYMLNNSGLQVRSEDGSISTINTEVTGGDGLIILEDGVFLASRWQGEIWIIEDGTATKLLDSKGDMQTADIGYIPEAKMVLVPRFFSNKVSAYKLSY